MKSRFSLFPLLASAALLSFLALPVSARSTYSVSDITDDDVYNLLGNGIEHAPVFGPQNIFGGGDNQAGVQWFSGFDCVVAESDGSSFTVFPEGIVLSTGAAAAGISDDGKNNANNSPSHSWEGDVTDTDLAAVFGKSLVHDVAGVILYVTPSNRTLNIPLMVASEEYFLRSTTYSRPTLSTYQSFNDCFAFFVEPGHLPYSASDNLFTNNIAKLAGDIPLSIGSVNPYTNQTFFVANVDTSITNANGTVRLTFPSDNIPIPFQYNGVITGPCAVMTNAVPGQEYTLKIVVGDGGNARDVDTAVFIKAKGITSGADLNLTVTVDPESLPDVGDGDTATFTFKVENVGPAPAWGVTLTNAVPASPDGAWSWSAPEVWNLPDLASGASFTTNLVVSFTDLAAAYPGLTVTGVVATATGDYDMSNNSDSATVSFAGTATVSATKVWADAGDQDGIRPSSVTFSLYANGSKVEDASVSAADGWAKTWSGLPKVDNGAPIAYDVREEIVPRGYDAPSIATNGLDFTVTNTHEPFTVAVTAQKVWVDADDQDGIRPSSVTFALSSNGVEVATAGVSASTGWAASWEGLAERAAGSPIAWTVSEPSVPQGYTATVGQNGSAWTVTNSHTPATVAVTAQKVWDDANDQDGLRPASATLSLYADGVKVEDFAATSTAPSNTWTDLPKFAAGQEIAYEVREDSVPDGYTASVASETTPEGVVWTVTNTHTPVTLDVTAQKVWADADDQDGLRPASVTLSLYADGVKKEDFAATSASPSNTWTGLPKFASSREIVYDVREDSVPDGYAASVTHAGNDWTVTNTHTPATVSVTAQKVWDDANDQDGIRPASATLSLYADGVKKEDFAATSAAPSNTWTDLPKFASGQEIVYEVREDSVPGGYDANVTHAGYDWTITNTHVPPTVDVTAQKVWEDDNNRDGLRPETVTFALSSNGVEVATAAVSASTGWAASWEGLAERAAGTAIAWTVAEPSVPSGYAAAVTHAGNDWTVTNTHEIERVTITATKVWDDANDQDGIRPDSVVFTFHDPWRATNMVATAANNWTVSWPDRPKRAGPNVGIGYRVAEYNPPDGYTVSVFQDGYDWTITNTHVPAIIDVTAQKVWDDADDQDGIRPSSVTFALSSNGVEVATADVSASTGWTASWEGLAGCSDGAAIAWTVAESSVPQGYTASVGRNGNDWTITNTHPRAIVDVTAQKVWDDANDQDGLRPASVTFALSSNGVEVATADVSESTGWSVSWEGLAERSAGAAIAWTVAEPSVPQGYTASVGQNGCDWTITNSHTPAIIDVTAQKVWDDANDQDGLRPASVTFALSSNGVEVATADVSESTGWAASWGGLAEYSAGAPVAWTVAEPSAPSGYVASVSNVSNDWTVTNSHVPAIVDVTAQKVWDDADDQDGLRPASVTFALSSNGVVVATADVSESTGWAASWETLAEFSSGAAIAWTVAEPSVPQGYTASVGQDGYDWAITNTHPRAIIDVTAQKVWDDANDQDGLRPASVTFALSSNGVEVATADVSESSGWAASWENLAEYSAGTAIAWTVAEPSAPSGYTASVFHDGNAWRITNKHTPETIAVTAQKIWDDADDQDGIRPDSAVLSFYENGVWVEDFTATEAMPSNTWAALPKFASGVEIEYRISEDSVPAGYTASVASETTPEGVVWTVTNTHEPETVSVSAAKVWDDAGDQDGLRPASATLSLYADGMKVEDFAATAAAPSNTWTDLPKFASGQEIAYEVREDTVPSGYAASVSHTGNDWTVTNTHVPETVSVTAKKVWSDANDKDGLRPAFATLSLYADGVKVEDFAATVSTPSKTWTDLPKCAAGRAISYTVREDSVPSGYTASTTRSGTTWTITNTHVVGAPKLSVSVTWTLSRSDGLFHGSVTVRNAGNLAFPVAANYWLATPGSRPTWYLYNPTGKLPDGSDYYDLTAAVQSAVKSAGNRNSVLDPGESVVVTGPLMYHRQRINPSKYLATSAFHAGTLFSPYDTNKDFKISAAELSAAEKKWKAGSVSDADILLVSLLNASPAYLWNDAAGALRGCADKR